MNNPLKNYRFGIELEGVVQARVQDIDTPDVELQEHQHGTPGNSPNKKTPGRKTVGDLIVQSLVPAEGGDPGIWAKLELAANGYDSSFFNDGFIIEYGNDGVTPVARYMMVNVWIKKIESTNLNSNTDNAADLIRTLTFAVEDYFRV